MAKIRRLLPILLIIAVMVWALPALLKAMPDRYIARLPEPIQKLGLPEEQEAILPTVNSPIRAEDLLVKTEDQAEELRTTPVATSVNLELDSDIENTVSFKIFDPVGILIYEELDISLHGKLTKNFSFDDLSAGIYFLNVFSKDIRYVKRIVIQK